MDFWGIEEMEKIKEASKQPEKKDPLAVPQSPSPFVNKFQEKFRRRYSKVDTELKLDANEDKKEAEAPKKNQVAKLTLPDGTVYELPVLESHGGPAGIDVRGFYSKSKYTLYDPGFTSTASCWSEITLIDGPNGRLTHRGYSIEDLCDNSDFMELSYLLIYGDLPTSAEREHHVGMIKNNMMVHQKFHQYFSGFLVNAHPMAIMCSVVGALASFFHDSLNIRDAESRVMCVYRLIAKMPTLAAMAYKTAVGQPVMYPKKKLSYAANFIYMLFATPSEDYEVNPVVAEAMDKFLMLHADHGQNASTSTVRIAGSSQANPYACIASGVCSLWGPAHGGANEAVLIMLEEIGSVENIPKFLAKAKDKKDPFRLMGFGHRVYKNYDPRARVMRKMCHKLLNELKIENEPLLDLAMELERIALNDDYFVKRKLFPNVDFYSGIVLKAMGIPRSMFTVLFSLGRTVGWISQWKEMIEDPKQRIGRPRQLYLGKSHQTYIPMDQRVSQKEDDVSDLKAPGKVE